MKKFLLFAAVASSMIAAQVLAQEPPTVSTAELSMRYCDAPVEEHIYQKIDINTTYQWEGDVYSETGNYTKVLQDDRGCDRIVTLHLTVRTNPTGSVDGLFSVSATERVYFSKGNLKYNSTASSPWSFANNQWESGTTFKFGTSGYDSYTPESGKFYYKSGNSPYSISKTSYDWGWYNFIENGGNVKAKWFTMEKQQWEYLLNNRASDLKYDCYQVHNVSGLLLLPDNWSWNNLTVEYDNPGGSPSAAAISDELWAEMEDNGAVFLPKVDYWTANNNGSWKPTGSATASYGWHYYVNVNWIVTFGEMLQNTKLNVRLVQSAQ